MAVVGAVATIAYLNSNTLIEGTNFLGQPDRHEAEFHKFISSYQRSYGTHAEYKHRMSIFKQNLEFIENHNAEEAGYSVALNHLADFS